ncbi:MAG TPA: BTAD domain-containing putative transcriptional regulator [Gaiellaceae bacterium]|nr:BTAD domain-containing putative transcriptional regulator [Gaiellaceae bacterium]
MVSYRLLGPLEVLAADGEPLVLGGQKQRGVLALLVLRANHVVASDSLIAALWGESPPRTAATSLQNAVSALRKLLGPDALETRAPGYRLVADEEAVDLLRFERLVESARELEPADQAERLREALALWRGEPLGDLASEAYASGEIRRLEELRLSTLERRLAADLACGRYDELVPELEGLVAAHPLRERLRGQLMLALYHSGRQGDALQAYQDLRRELVDELGLEPGPELQTLHGQILRQEVPHPRLTETVADGAHFEEVVDALLSGRLVPVLGADVGALADRLAQRFEYYEDGRDLSRVAQYVALTKGPGPLYDELRALLEASAVPTPVHRFFASLPPMLRERGVPHQLLVTTSYDLLLEQALLDAGEAFDIVSYVASGRNRGRFMHREPGGVVRVIDLPNTYVSELSLERRTIVLKLHGDGEESFVVTEDDYIGYLAHGDIGAAVPVALAAKLRRSHFLFLGFGVREWSLRLVLDRICAGDPLAYRSWAVVGEAQPLEREFWRARDIDLLEHPLDNYVEGLGRYVAAGAPA